MIAHTLDTLEWGALLRLLAKHAASKLGKEAALALMPAETAAEARERLRRLDEAHGLMIKGLSVPFGGLRDVRDSLERARRGAVLEGRDFLDLGGTLRAGRLAKAFLLEEQAQAPALWLLIEPMAVLATLERDIDDTFMADGKLKDSASQELSRIRRDIKEGQVRIKDRLIKMMQSSAFRSAMQEPIITQRNERYVLPVKVEAQSQIPGIVHDQSASGATVYLEPMAVVELNNRLRRHVSEEEAEIARIMAEMSLKVAEQSVAIHDLLLRMTELDLITAKARLSVDYRGSAPALNEDGRIHLEQARHPLLIHQLGFDKVVPMDVTLDDDHRMIIITGPNTGGKTVSLKTVGLFALMAKAGLHIPARDGSEMAFFGQVMADIGDEQSLTQSLSTFSGHMRQIVRILEQADDRSLVLIDEIGTGTDPDEGAALARAILETLNKRHARAMVTTHFGELKTLAYEEGSGIQNAAVEFDVETLSPTYRLMMGLPGRSNALAIAQRLGLSDEVVQRARAVLGTDQEGISLAIEGLEKDRQAWSQLKKDAERDKREAEALKAEWEKAHKALLEERLALKEGGSQELLDQVEAAKAQVAELVRRLQNKGTAQEAQKVYQELEKVAKKHRPKAAQPPKEDGGLKPGDRVYVPKLGTRAEVVRVGNQYVEVAMGALKMKVPLSDLQRSADQTGLTRPVSTPKTSYTPAPTRMECDLRGMVAQEAVETAAQFIDQAYASNLHQVFLIHGKGSGALRKAIQDYLKGSPYRLRFRDGALPEGGAGVTVVELG